MSTSLAREAIELFENVTEDKDSRKKEKKVTKLKGVQKNSKKKPVKEKKLALSSNAFDEKWRYKTIDRTQENLKFIKNQQIFSAVDTKAATLIQRPDEELNLLILEHHRKRKSSSVQNTEQIEQSSVFNDRDFDEFEKEYNF